MIIEVRRYTLKPGRREEFIEFFEQENRVALRDAGMLVFGPLRDLDNPDKVHWMRAFSSLEERDRIKDSFYKGPVWNKHIEPLVMPLILHFEADVPKQQTGLRVSAVVYPSEFRDPQAEGLTEDNKTRSATPIVVIGQCAVIGNNKKRVLIGWLINDARTSPTNHKKLVDRRVGGNNRVALPVTLLLRRTSGTASRPGGC